MRIKLSNARGITLIALVITIVILIILAGVAINLTLGENGILNKAKYAREEYQLAQEKEKLEIEILNIQTQIMETEGRIATLNDLQEEIDTTKYTSELHYEPLATLENVNSVPTYAIVNKINTEYYFIVDSRLVITDVRLGELVEKPMYIVTFNGENVTSSGTSTIQENKNYTTKLTVADGYKITSIEVKMEGKILTQGENYTYENDSLIIRSVTGNLEITITTVQDVPTVSNPSIGEERVVRTGSELPFSWEELNEIAKVISNNDDLITSETSEFTLYYKGRNYIVGVGDYKTVIYDTVPYTVKILGFNHDTLTNPTIYENADGSTNETAGITFEFVDCIMQSTMEDINGGSTNAQGWETRDIRVTLNETTKSALSNSLQIKQVQKTYLLGNKGTNNTNKTSDYLWLLACSEIWDNGHTSGNCVAGYALATEGLQYKYYKQIDAEYNSANDYLVKTNKETSVDYWYLRSPGYSYNTIFCCVDAATGSADASTIGYSRWISPCFAI